ncbi:hypothetical protein EDC96DRAFT_507713, partial [Choanephora cucurbitarum]
MIDFLIVRNKILCECITNKFQVLEALPFATLMPYSLALAKNSFAQTSSWGPSSFSIFALIAFWCFLMNSS